MVSETGEGSIFEIWVGEAPAIASGDPATAECVTQSRNCLKHCTLTRSGIDYLLAGKSKTKFRGKGILQPSPLSLC